VKIAARRERAEQERRVALTPDGVARLARSGHEVLVEKQAGASAGFPDAEYAGAGAEVVESPWAADLVVAVQPPAPEEGDEEGDGPREAGVLVSMGGDEAWRRFLAERRATAFALERMPRTTRAQSMDVLSSMSTVAGYRAAILGAYHSGRLFPLLMTAAGTIPPARVLVVGAGVAGLQAIATARRLGADVEAFDTRPAVKEEVLSLGARFVELDVGGGGQDEAGYAKELSEEAKRRERDALQKHVEGADVVITTALVPGRPAPLIVTEAMVEAMRPGSVIVDLAAPTGGNCALTEPGEVVTRRDVTISGPLNLPSEMPNPASRMFSRNVVTFLAHLAPEGELKIDLDDEIQAACCVVHGGEVRA